MDATRDFIANAWANLDGWLMFYSISSGILLGTLAGLLIAICLQRCGWLARVNRWHHLLLKLYFVALPGLGAFLGMQAGVLHAAEKQLHREIDRQQPYVEAIARTIVTSFHDYMEETGRYELAKYTSLSPRQTMLLMVDDFIAATPIHIAANPDKPSFGERWLQSSLERSRRALLVRLVDEVIIPAVQEVGDKYTQLNADTIKRIMHVPVDTWFDAQSILDFSKTQVSRIWFSYYLVVLAQWLLMMVLIGLEFAVSTYLRQRRRSEQHTAEAHSLSAS